MNMAGLKAHVVNGEVVLDEPIVLEEGAAVEVYVLIGDDELTPAERAELEAGIEEGFRDIERGDFEEGDVVVDRLLARHGLTRRDTDPPAVAPAEVALPDLFRCP